MLQARFRRVALAHALAFALFSPLTALAQSITGGIYGKLNDIQDVAVAVKNPATGYQTTLTPDTRGYYSVDRLAPGVYTVTLLKSGHVVDEKTLSVRAGAASAAVFAGTRQQAAAGSAEVHPTELGAVTVSGTATAVNAIDVSTVENTQIWNSSDVNNLPVTSRGLEGVSNLQSNVTVAGKLDSAAGYTGGYVQYNGASPNENRYFINQFDVTNVSNLLTPSGLPDEAISTIQTKSYGYGVEYGDTTGGVASATVKQGSNIFKFGSSVYFTPPTSSWLNPNPPNVRNALDPSQYNNNLNAQAAHSEGLATENFWSSGPIVKDHLFYYVLFTDQPPSSQSTYNQTSKNVFDQNPSHSGLVNLTWNINKDQTADLLLYRWRDSNITNQYALSQPYNPGSAASAPNNYSYSVNNEWLGIFNYSGKITDSLHMSAMYGYWQTRNFSTSQSIDEGTGLPDAQYFNYTTQQSITPPGGEGPQDYASPFVSTIKGYRLDFDWTPSDDHHVSFGLDHYYTAAAGVSQTNPNGVYNYYVNQCQAGVAACALPNGALLGNGVPYVQQSVFSQNDNDRNVTKSFYLDDTWQASKNVVVYAGLRHDVYISKLDTGQTYLRLPYNSPRVGVSWDVHGDSSLKLGATAGRYAAGLGVNYNDLAGAAYINQSYYSTYQCGSAYCADNGYIPKNTQQVGPPTGVNGNVPAVINGQVSHNVKPSYQDDFSVYAQQQFADTWTATATFFVSKLRNLEEYWNDNSLVNQYLATRGYNYQIPADALGYLYNPGKSLDITLPVGPGGAQQRVTIPNNFLGMPSPRRKNYQLTFTLDHPATPDEPWFLDISYTWRHLFGNTGGATNVSGSANSNVFSNGYDQAWQAPAYLDGAGGNLQADSKNTLKINGYYKFRSGLRLGGTFEAATGIPLSCYNYYPYTNDNRVPNAGNTQDSYYCANQLVSRGTAGETSFWDQLDLDAGYDFGYRENSFSVDLKVTNVFNRNAVLQKEQIYNSNASLNVPSAAYMTPTLFQPPRTTMLVFRWQYH